MSRVVVHEKQRIFDDVFKIDEVRLSYQRFDGTMSTVVRRLNFERGDSVAAVLYDEDRDRVILVNQFRYSTYDRGPGWITETVAGMIDEGETSGDAIRREVIEETGYEIDEVIHISTFYVSPGGTSERVILYYSRVSGVSRYGPGGRNNNGNEDIEIVELSLDDAMRKIKNGDIVDAKTQIGLLWLNNHLNN